MKARNFFFLSVIALLSLSPLSPPLTLTLSLFSSPHSPSPPIILSLSSPPSYSLLLSHSPPLTVTLPLTLSLLPALSLHTLLKFSMFTKPCFVLSSMTQAHLVHFLFFLSQICSLSSPLFLLTFTLSPHSSLSLTESPSPSLSPPLTLNLLSSLSLLPILSLSLLPSLSLSPSLHSPLLTPTLFPHPLSHFLPHSA